MQILFQPFQWYDNPDLRNHHKKQCEEDCHFKLLTPQNHMLPFQLRRPKSPLPITGLVWSCPDGTAPFILDPSVIQIYTAGEWDYIIYDGRELSVCPDCADEPFPCGWLVATITDGVNTWYSEMFFVEPGDEMFISPDGQIWTDENGDNITDEAENPLYTN